MHLGKDRDEANRKQDHQDGKTQVDLLVRLEWVGVPRDDCEDEG
jgi:hypothetical protein